MTQVLYEGKNKAQKIQLLKESCYQSELGEVKFHFTEEDLDEMKSRLSEVSIEREQNQDELKEMSKDIRAKIKQNDAQIKELISFLRNKFEIRIEEVYHFDDQEKGLMLTYNGDGELISTRELRPSERQTRLKG